FLTRRFDTHPEGGVPYVPVVYDLTGPIRFGNEADRSRFAKAWVKFQTGLDEGGIVIDRYLNPHRRAAASEMETEFLKQLEEAAGNPRLALELLRLMCACSRAIVKGERIFNGDLVIILEGAELLIPRQEAGDSLHRVATCLDWFTDAGFLEGKDTVILITESRGLIHDRVAKLPVFGEVELPLPDETERLRFIRWYVDRQSEERKPRFWSTDENLSVFTAGLTIHALRQLLIGASHDAAAGRESLQLKDVTRLVEHFIQAQLGGDEAVEYLRPEHKLDDLIGFRRLKAFIREEIIPGIQDLTKDAISSVIVCGPNRAGKTHLFEGVAGELGIVILVLKNLRSQWYGQTDVIFGRLKRVLSVLRKALIYVNEADTQFGGVGKDSHETERRLTGRLQAMMSDPKLKGRIHWILDTARPHLLSVDIRQPGRGGDCIVGVFDPEVEERKEFIRWATEHVLESPLDDAAMAKVEAATGEYSVGAYTTLRSTLKRKAKKTGGKMTLEAVLYVVENTMLPDVGLERRYQTLHAALNCSWKPLLPSSLIEVPRAQLYKEVAELESLGIN
ncbi:MAG: ATP-binding protein, partial [bacterium]|nr:ATP-binding protein [bacterium]